MDNGLIVNILVESMSEDHVTIIKKLSKPKRDEELAAELNVKETIVRTLLNDLHARSLVEYERIKDKRTGWYTYLWKRRSDKIEEYISNYLHDKLNDLYRKLDEEKNGTFRCSCSRVSLEKAMDTNFICPECNEPYVNLDNSDEISKIETEIARINNFLKSI